MSLAEQLLQAYRANGYFEKIKIQGNPKSFLPYPSYKPGGMYDEQWDWDAIFMGIASAWAGEPDARERLQGVVRNMLAIQMADGRIPGCVKAETGPNLKLFHVKPLIAQAAWLASETLGASEWLLEKDAAGIALIDKLVRAVDYRRNHPQLWNQEYGLASWYNYMESGADDNVALGSPRILADIEPDAYEAFYTKQTTGILAADVNAFLYQDYLALSRILSELGDARMVVFTEHAQTLCANMRKHLWHAEDATFYNRLVNGEWVRRHTYSNIIPLWAGVACLNDGQEMIRRYVLNPEFYWSTWGIRTLAKNDSDYNVTARTRPSNWQGPVWPICNALTTQALVAYQFLSEASTLAEKSAQVVLQDLESEGFMHENYDGDTGKALAVPNFMSWNLLLPFLSAQVEKGQHSLLLSVIEK